MVCLVVYIYECKGSREFIMSSRDGERDNHRAIRKLLRTITTLLKQCMKKYRSSKPWNFKGIVHIILLFLSFMIIEVKSLQAINENIK